MNFIRVAAFLMCLFVVPAHAVKLYKWVDKEGNVTYQETPPPPNSVKSEEKHIDPDQNVIQSEVPRSSATRSRPAASSPTSKGAGAEPPKGLSPAQQGAGSSEALPEAPSIPPPPISPSPGVPPPPISPPPAVPPPPIFPPPPPGGGQTGGG